MLISRRHRHKIYRARGDMENRAKECQIDLLADRTSTATMRANQLRLWFASMAYVLLCALQSFVESCPCLIHPSKIERGEKWGLGHGKCEPLHSGAAKTGVSIFVAFISVSATKIKRFTGRERALIGRSAMAVIDVLSPLSDYRHRRTCHDHHKASGPRQIVVRAMNKT
jgi:hypothetical protein